MFLLRVIPSWNEAKIDITYDAVVIIVMISLGSPPNSKLNGSIIVRTSCIMDGYDFRRLIVSRIIGIDRKAIQ